MSLRPASSRHFPPLSGGVLLAAGGLHGALWAGNFLSPWLAAAAGAGLGLIIRHARTGRQAFYGGTAAGLLLFVPHLWFLLGLFGGMAVALWCCLAIWHAAFCATLHTLAPRMGARKSLLFLPAAAVLWLGLEYFRSEVWGLRFAWLTPGFTLPAGEMGWLFRTLGVYGSGVLLITAGMAAVTGLPGRRTGLAAALILPGLFLIPASRSSAGPEESAAIRVTGVQFEHALNRQILEGLEAARTRFPDTRLYVLPEYSFQGPVPPSITAWCRTHAAWLIAGGTDPVAPRSPLWHNTAFVIGPDGTPAHRQAKAMPIQFFEDGEPATRQEVWHAPWGKTGICICYDQNYTKVTDVPAAQGMRLLVIPTMDLESWGAHQHVLSARLASTRAVEYGVPVIRLASSGISQMLDRQGRLLGSGSFPGQGEIVSAIIPLGAPARLPLDRLPARLAVIPAGVMIFLALGLGVLAFIRSFKCPLLKGRT